ncbi:helix-turn-helix domain-containing protein [Halobaculum sp. CBA1158]|uniref:ArsR/SmtB family transcription factor n=1 Tax=Halobaculum sp. CBA1158 TaxID=2904243 RepID=UPI001F3D3DDD|nr:helix-turn-helix domain-containing protein [Halobaculum sp. CBA1158]UIO98923.1 helix-turn-helix domain-containing protein [Halobaculum sp. CBA1158]
MSADAHDADPDWNTIGSVMASDHRVAVLDRLTNGPATPTTIAEDTGLSVSHVSRALGQLRDADLVELLVPEERRKGRIYGTTDDGVAAAHHIDDLDGEGGA